MSEANTADLSEWLRLDNTFYLSTEAMGGLLTLYEEDYNMWGDIDKEKAIEIIEVLQGAFDLNE